MTKAAARERRAAAARRDDGVLHETGIRSLRRKPVVNTPNVFPPAGFEPHDSGRARMRCRHTGRRWDRGTVTSASRTTRSSITSTTSCVPPCADVELRQADRAGRSARPRRAADRRAREDRLSGRPQAAARRRAADRHHALPARFGAAIRAASRTSPSGAIGSRSSGSTCVTRRASKRSAASCSPPAPRLDFIVNNACQTVRRPPDFYAHMMDGRDRGAAATCRSTCGGCSAGTKDCAGITCCRDGASAAEPRRLRQRDAARRSEVAGLTHAPSCRRCRCCRKSCRRRRICSREGQLDQDLQQVDLRGRNSWRLLLDEVSVGRAARGAARERGRAVHPQRAAQAADAAHARARQAHRQRLGGRRAVLPQLQDHAASAYEHGEGRAQHDDAHGGRRLPRRRHSHEQRGYRLGDRRGSRRRSRRGRRRSTGFIRRWTSSTAPRGSSIRSSPASTPASTCGDSS